MTEEQLAEHRRRDAIVDRLMAEQTHLTGENYAKGKEQLRTALDLALHITDNVVDTVMARVQTAEDPTLVMALVSKTLGDAVKQMVSAARTVALAEETLGLRPAQSAR